MPVRGRLGQPTDTPNAFQQMVSTVPGLPSSNPGPYVSTLLPTTAGYALMTQMAETAVANEYLTLESGWLSNVAIPNPALGIDPGTVNISGCGPACVVQFIPIGYYSDGSTHPQNNTSWGGNNGTWSGVDFHEWVMYIE